MAGKDITKYIQQELRERGEYVPPEDSLNIAKHIKVCVWFSTSCKSYVERRLSRVHFLQEAYCYVCPDIAKEFKKYDEDATKFRQYDGLEAKTQKV